MRVRLITCSALCLGALLLAEPAQAAGRAKGKNQISVKLAKKCKKVLRVGHGFLWKPSSQDSGYPRIGKPALVFTTNKPTSGFLPIYSASGKAIGYAVKFYYPGAFDSTYYVGMGSGETASQLAREARRSGKRRQIYVDIGGKRCYGPINPEFRSGSV